MKFEQLLDIMHCDFFEIQKDGKTLRCSDRYNRGLKDYYSSEVIDFYAIKSTTSNATGLLIRLAREETVNNYLDTLDAEQIVTVYDDKHNIHYHGKAGYAPLDCYFEFINTIFNGNEIIINA